MSMSNLRILKVRRARFPKGRRGRFPEMDWQMAVLTPKVGDLIRDLGLGRVSEVLGRDFDYSLKLRDTLTGDIYYQNRANCRPVSALEALGEQSE